MILLSTTDITFACRRRLAASTRLWTARARNGKTPPGTGESASLPCICAFCVSALHLRLSRGPPRLGPCLTAATPHSATWDGIDEPPPADADGPDGATGPDGRAPTHAPAGGGLPHEAAGASSASTPGAAADGVGSARGVGSGAAPRSEAEPAAESNAAAVGADCGEQSQGPAAGEGVGEAAAAGDGRGRGGAELRPEGLGARVASAARERMVRSMSLSPSKLRKILHRF